VYFWEGQLTRAGGPTSLFLGEVTRSHPLAQEVYDVRREILGRYHTATALSISQLADIYEEVKEFSKAEALYNQAIEALNMFARRRELGLRGKCKQPGSSLFRVRRLHKSRAAESRLLCNRKETLRRGQSPLRDRPAQSSGRSRKERKLRRGGAALTAKSLRFARRLREVKIQNMHRA